MAKKKASGKKTEPPVVESGLTPKQELFVREYLIDKNGTQAAIRAGYSEKCAGQQAFENLSKPEIVAAIDRAIAAQYKRLDITADRILAEYMLIATVDIADAYDESGNLLPIRKMPEQIRRAIAAVEVDELFDGYGDDRTQIGVTKKLKLIDKKGALDALAKNLGLLKDVRDVNVKGKLTLEQLLAASQEDE